MSSQSDFEARLVATLEDYEIRERYNAEDPMVVQTVKINRCFSFFDEFGN